MDVPYIIEVSTDSSGEIKHPCKVCPLVKSFFCARQTGEIWGLLLRSTLLNWGLKNSTTYRRLYFSKRVEEFIIVDIVVDDLALHSNSQPYLNALKKKLAARFDIRLLGAWKTFD